MNQVQTGKAPIHLWIVGLLSLLWNAMGCTDYWMIRTRNMEWIAQTPGVTPEEMLAWVDSFPIWAQVGWALGVWMGLAGSVLLLLRKRWAVEAYGLSLLGAVAGFANPYLGSPPPVGLAQGFMAYMPAVLIVISGLLFYYANRQKQSGVLR